MEWLPLITAVLSLLGIVLKTWQDGAPKRAKENRDEEIQKGRADIAAGNADAVTERIDRLLTVQDGTPSGNAGSASGPVEAGTADTLRRLGDLGISTGEAPGEGGSVQTQPVVKTVGGYEFHH